MKKFKSSYSTGMVVATILLMLLMVYGIYRLAIQMQKYPMDSWQFIVALIAASIIIVSVVYAFVSQIEYVGLTENDLIIQKKVGKIVLPLNNVVRIRHKKSIIMDIRLWGISGLFGHIGLFRNGDVGNYIAFVKDGNSMLEIKTTTKTYVVSCDKYNEVLEILYKKQDKAEI